MPRPDYMTKHKSDSGFLNFRPPMPCKLPWSSSSRGFSVIFFSVSTLSYRGPTTTTTQPATVTTTTSVPPFQRYPSPFPVSCPPSSAALPHSTSWTRPLSPHAPFSLRQEPPQKRSHPNYTRCDTLLPPSLYPSFPPSPPACLPSSRVALLPETLISNCKQQGHDQYTTAATATTTA